MKCVKEKVKIKCVVLKTIAIFFSLDIWVQYFNNVNKYKSTELLINCKTTELWICMSVCPRGEEDEMNKVSSLNPLAKKKIYPADNELY